MNLFNKTKILVFFSFGLSQKDAYLHFLNL